MIRQNRSFFVFSHHLTVFNSNQNIYLTRINSYNQAVFGTRLLKPLRSKSTKSSSQSSLDGAKMLLPGRSKTEHWPRSKLREGGSSSSRVSAIGTFAYFSVGFPKQKQQQNWEHGCNNSSSTLSVLQQQRQLRHNNNKWFKEVTIKHLFKLLWLHIGKPWEKLVKRQLWKKTWESPWNFLKCVRFVLNWLWKKFSQENSAVCFWGENFRQLKYKWQRRDRQKIPYFAFWLV